jgi:hypothetical protein
MLMRATQRVNVSLSVAYLGDINNLAHAAF